MHNAPKSVAKLQLFLLITKPFHNFFQIIFPQPRQPGRPIFCPSPLSRKKLFRQERENHPENITFVKIYLPNGRIIYCLGPKIPPLHILIGCGAESPDSNPAQRHTDQPSGPRLPLLRFSRCRQDHLRPYLCENHQLRQPHPAGRPLQRVPILQGIQRKPVAQHHRA